MDADAHLAAVERELDAFIAAVAVGPSDADVPTCPDWDVDGLADHVGSLLGFWSHLLCDATGRPHTQFDPTPVDGDRVAWLRALGAELLPLLSEVAPDAEVGSWYPPDQTAGFWRRRIAHELAIHRVDAQAARGTVAPVDAELAVDGIEELLLLADNDTPDDPRRHLTDGRSIHLHGTDHDAAEWLLTLGPGPLQVERRHAKGDLALRGAVSDLEMLLYQRPVVGEVERFGDDAALGAFHATFTFA